MLTCKKPDKDGYYPVVLDSCLIDHHDAISYFDSNSGGEYSIRVVMDEDNNPYIWVRFAGYKADIIISHGEWYFANWGLYL